MNRRETPAGAPHPPIRSGPAFSSYELIAGRSDSPVKPTSEVAHQPGQQPAATELAQPMLDLYPGQLVKTTHFDQTCRLLADRHYSRRTVGARQFAYSGRKLVLRDTDGLVLWVWMFPDPAMRMDGQTGYNCAIFRNESARLASEIILEAEQWAIDKWGPDRMYTYVDGRKVRSSNPGYCYLMAGWHPHGYSKSGQRLLVKYDGCGHGSAEECSAERSRAHQRQGVAPAEGRAWETPAMRTV